MVGLSAASVVVGAAVLSVLLAVAVGGAPISRQTVLAAAPWAVVAAGVIVAGRGGVYDAVSSPPSSAVLLAAVVTLAAVSWVLLIQFATLRNLSQYEWYLAATGIGASIVVLAVTGAHFGAVASRVVWLAVVPVVAVAIAAGAYFALGVVYIDALTRLRFAGLYTLAAVLFDGVASVAVIEVLGGEELAVTTQLLYSGSNLAGVGVEVAYLLPIHLLAGVAVVVGCSWLVGQRSWLGYGCALAVSASTLCSATLVLSSAVFLG
jgi:hypothetical protein